MDHGLGGAELQSGGPATMLYAENIQRQRLRPGSDDAIFGDDAILFTSAYEFTSEKKNRPLPSVYQNQLVHRRAGVVLRQWNTAAARHAIAALLANDDITAGKALVQRYECTGIPRNRTNHRKDGDIFVGDGIEKAPIALRFGLRTGRS
jgi:hypothetical protein